MSSQPERDYITQGTGRAVARFPPPAQNQRSRLHAWGRREPRAPPLPPQLRPCVPAPHPQRPPPAPAPPTPPRRSRPARLRTSAVRGPWGASARGPVRGKGAAGHLRASADGGRGARLHGRGARTRASAHTHTHTRAAPRGRHCRGPRRHSGAADARPAPPPPPRAPSPHSLSRFEMPRPAKR